MDARGLWGLVPLGLWLVCGPQVGAAGLAVFVGVGAWTYRNERRRTLVAIARAPIPSPADHFPARIHFLARNRHRDRDDGLVTFLDGWMLFEGDRLRFALRAQDVLSLMPDGGDLEIVLKQRHQSMLLQGDRAFERHVADWYRASVPVEGEPTLPKL